MWPFVLLQQMNILPVDERTAEDFRKQLKEQAVNFQYLLSGLSRNLMMQVEEKDKCFKRLLSDRDELAKCLEEKNKELSMKSTKELQCVMESNQLQVKYHRLYSLKSQIIDAGWTWIGSEKKLNVLNEDFN